ncbi:MAG TPA: ATP synthase F1 subunit epsilon [Pirellulaceae bacterium]|nr:ATP synthase F1 subunit epsilon [Pirellulaceae bacterium]
MSQLTCVVVTPETTVVDEQAEFVAVPLYDGELGILPGRAPLIGRLGYGELRLRTANKIERYYIDGGFVQVVDNIVSVLTNRAVLASRINTQAAGEQLEAAMHRPVTTVELEAIRERLINQARAQLQVAGKR